MLLGLSDPQLESLMAFARDVPQEKRHLFLQRVDAMLTLKGPRLKHKELLHPCRQLRTLGTDGATTRMRAIMPPSSCSRIWQWNTKSPICVNGMLTHTDSGLQAPL